MLEINHVSHNCCPWPKGVSWPWHTVISPRSRSQCTHRKNQCPGHNSLLFCRILIIFHSFVVYYPMVCHDFDPRSHYTHSHDHFPSHNTLKCLNWIMFYTSVVNDPRVCNDLDPRSLCSRSRSQCTHREKCPGHRFSSETWIWIILHKCQVLSPAFTLPYHTAGNFHVGLIFAVFVTSLKSPKIDTAKTKPYYMHVSPIRSHQITKIGLREKITQLHIIIFAKNSRYTVFSLVLQDLMLFVKISLPSHSVDLQLT